MDEPCPLLFVSGYDQGLGVVRRELIPGGLDRIVEQGQK